MEDFAEITALIADRATLFRRGLVRLLRECRPGWSCAEAGLLDEVQAHLSVEPVDLLLLDLQFVGAQQAIDLRRLRESFPEQRIVVVADSDDRTTILECLAAGANGYILKSTTMTQLLRAIEIVLSGGVYAPATLAGIPPTAGIAVVREPESSPLLASLTDRQIDVFNLLSEGCATKTIARRLGLAVGTVKVHLAAIYRIMGAHNRVEAIAKSRAGTGQTVLVRPTTAMAGELCA